MPFNLAEDNMQDLQAYLKQKNKAMKAEKNAVLDIIQPWYQKTEESSNSEIERKQKQKELIDLGCFINTYNNSIQITNGLREKPDFEVEWNGKKVGIELRDIIRNHDAKRTEGTFDSFFREIERELFAVSPELKGIYRVKFTKALTVFNRKVKSELKPIIIEAIVKDSQPESNYIESISKSSHSKIHLYTSKGAMIGDLERKTIETAVSEKTNLLKTYARNEIDENWLLLVLGGAKESSNYNIMESTIFDLPFPTGFDRLFLFDFFRKEVFELKVE